MACHEQSHCPHQLGGNYFHPPFLQKQKLKIIWKKELQSDQRTVTAPHWKYKCIFKC